MTPVPSTQPVYPFAVPFIPTSSPYSVYCPVVDRAATGCPHVRGSDSSAQVLCFFFWFFSFYVCFSTGYKSRLDKLITHHFSFGNWLKLTFFFLESPCPCVLATSSHERAVSPVYVGPATGLDLTSVLIQQLDACTKIRLLTGCEHAPPAACCLNPKVC